MLGFLLFLSVFFIQNTCANAKSCLHTLPRGHNAVIATYNDKNECIIKYCVFSYKLFHNECFEKEKYEKLAKEETVCVDSGGKFERSSVNILGCTCHDDKYLVHNNCDGIIIPDCEHKCKIYNQNDCDRWEVIEQHVLRGNIDAFKTCMNKLKTSKYSDLSVRQKERENWIPVYSSILTTAYKGDFSFMDAAIDAGMLTVEDYVVRDVGLTYRSACLGGSGTLISEVLSVAWENDYHDGHLNVLKYLNEQKKMLDLNKKYLITADTRCGFGDDVYAYPLEYIINDLLEAEDRDHNCYYTIEPDGEIRQLGVSDLPRNVSEDVFRVGKQMAEYLFNQSFDISIMDPYRFRDGPRGHLITSQGHWFKWLHNEKGIKYKPGTRPFCADRDEDANGNYVFTGQNIADELNEMLKEDCPECASDELIKQTCEWEEQKADSKYEELKQKYEEAKANEQSLANRTLTALTTAATGIGGMELAMGLSEQKADKEADMDMTAYIETMRCTYGDGKQVKAGSEEIELPGGNDETLMKLRNEYFALANDLKERKTALGMKPGIESEEIIDKAQTGLYDDESLSTDSGAYESLYRAKMLGSETDQTKIDENKEASKKRVIAGGVLSGVGVVGGVVGNSMINGKLGEMIKENKNKKSVSNTNKSVINKLKAGLKSTGMTNVDKLDFSNLDLSSMSGVVDKIDFTSMSDLKGKSATEILNTSDSSSFTSSFGNILGSKNVSLFQ